MLVNGKKILQDARAQGYGIGAFNFVNMEMLQVLLQAANEERSPIIVQTSEGAIKYMGDPFVKGFIEVIKEVAKVPVVMHLDHGQSFEMCKRCIDMGYTSVMIDASKLPFEENIELTKKVVEYAYDKNVAVEAELGTIGGVEDNVSCKEIIYTDPESAKEFVEKTRCHTLAVAIGTSHGAYKFKAKAELNYDILKKVKEIVTVPLVLHGASSVPASAVDRVNKYGGQIEHSCGVDDESMQRAVQGGICKVNTDTDLRLTWTGIVIQVLIEKPEEFDLRKIIGPARENMLQYIKHRMKVMGSSGKA